jgi:rod shape-determining protein MreD
MKIFFRIMNFIILILCLIFQFAFLENLKLINIGLDIALVAIIGISIFNGEIYGLISGFLAGMLIDIMAGSIIGVTALLYSVDAFLASRIYGFDFRKKTLANVLLIMLVTEINILFMSGIYYLFGFATSSAKLGIEMLTSPLFNIFAMFIIFPLLNLGRERKDEIGFIFKKKA